MSLFTRNQYDQLIANGSSRNITKDPPPVVKLWLQGMDCVWLLTELDPGNPLLAFGLCDLGMGFPELGYVDLSEIASLKLPLGVTIEQDEDFTGLYPISVYASAARTQQRITEDQDMLRRYHLRRQPGLFPC